MRANKLTDLLVASLEAAVPVTPISDAVLEPTPEPVLPVVEVTLENEGGADNTDSLDIAPSPPVTHEELEEHLEEDRIVHEQLHHEIEQVKGLVQGSDGATVVLSSIASLEGIGDNDLCFSNIALEQLGCKLGLSAPVLRSENGKVATASMEGLRSWISLLRNSSKDLMVQFDKGAANTGLHAEKTIAHFRTRIALLSKMLEGKTVLTPRQVKLPRDLLVALQVGDSYSQDLAKDLSKFFTFCTSASNRTAEQYVKTANDVYSVIGAITPATDEAQVEALFKQAASAVDLDFYQAIEPGTNVYLGNVTFRKPPYAPRVSLPKWFSPVQEMVSRGGYEPSVAKVNPKGEVVSLSAEECSNVLLAIQEGMVALDTATATWSRSMSEIKAVWNAALEKNSLLQNQEAMELSPELNAVAWYGSSVASYMPGAAWSGIGPIYSYVITSAFAALSLVELSVLDR